MPLNINEILTNHVCAKHSEEWESNCPMLRQGHGVWIRLLTCAKWKLDRGWGRKKGEWIANCFVTTDKLKLALWSFAQFNILFPADLHGLYIIHLTFFLALYFTQAHSYRFPIWRSLERFHYDCFTAVGRTNKRKGSIEVGFKRIWRIVSLIIHVEGAALCWAHLSEWVKIDALFS